MYIIKWRCDLYVLRKCCCPSNIVLPHPTQRRQRHRHSSLPLSPPCWGGWTVCRRRRRCHPITSSECAAAAATRLCDRRRPAMSTAPALIVAALLRRHARRRRRLQQGRTETTVRVKCSLEMRLGCGRPVALGVLTPCMGAF